MKITKEKLKLNLFLICLLIITLSISAYTIIAKENTYQIKIDFYSADNDYSTSDGEYVAWVWIQGSLDGVLLQSTNNSEDYYETDATGEINYAKEFILELTESQANALTNGSTLGMVFPRYKAGNTEPTWSTKDISEDRVVQIEFVDNQARVFTLKDDATCYTDLETAKEVFLKILTAKFEDTNSISFKTTSQVDTSAIARVYDSENNQVIDDANVSIDSNKMGGSINFSNIQDFDYSKNYYLEVDGFTGNKIINKQMFLKTAEFLKQYQYNGQLGSIVETKDNKTTTTFRVFAPLSTEVKTNIYNTGEPVNRRIIGSYTLKKTSEVSSNWNGVWEVTVDKDLSNCYYNYFLTTYDTIIESIDPYAYSAGSNGNIGMIVNHDELSPKGWDEDSHIYESNPTNTTEAIIYEVHIRDFSIAANSGMKNKGKYLAFTEDNTSLFGFDDITTGVAHLKELGITYVHLLPAFDYSSVNENTTNDITNDYSSNWGYDPLNYNVPEGSYSSNPKDGKARVLEFKQMVMALHDANIGVIMDMVYNHTSSISNSAFHKTTPGYYHRFNSDGNYTDGSGCGNEVADERYMVRKYIVDSVLYWAEEYHIDGFRFDLMALETIKTMNDIRESLDNLYGDNIQGNSNILMYGEPWAAVNDTVEGVANQPDTWPANRANYEHLDNDIAIFSDTIRDGLRGEHGNKGEMYGPFGGYFNGNTDNLNMVKSGIQGSVHDNDYQNDNYVKTKSPAQQIVYSSAHDNYTLWDQMIMSLSARGENNAYSPSDTVFDLPREDVVNRNMQLAATQFTSKGTVFMQAGEEFARTKYGNHNSYNSPDGINGLDYSRKIEFNNLFEFYKGMISLRKQNDYLTDLSYESAKEDVYFLYNTSDPAGDNQIWADSTENTFPNAPLAYVLKDRKSTKFTIVIVNSYDDNQACNLGFYLANLKDNGWVLPNTLYLISDGTKMGSLDKPLDEINTNEAYYVPDGKVWVLST